MLYIPVNDKYNTFALGVFSSEQEAINAYIRFLELHENYDRWFKKNIQRKYNKRFGGSISSLKDLVTKKDELNARYNDVGSVGDDVDSINNDIGFIDDLFDVGYMCQIHEVEPRTLFYFSDYDGWVSGENLYQIVNACLKNKCFNIDLQYYARTYPVLKHKPRV
jgi:hypothetical protein